MGDGSRPFVELVAVAPGIPFGLTFLGRKLSEETLIRLAYAFEQATHHRDAVVPGEMGVLPRTEIVDVLENSTSHAPTATSSTSPPIATGAAAKRGFLLD